MEAVKLMKNVSRAATQFGWTVRSKGEVMRVFAESEAAGKLIIEIKPVSARELLAKVVTDINLHDYSDKEADAIRMLGLQRNTSREHTGAWTDDADSMRMIYTHHISEPGEDKDLTDAVAEIERFMEAIAVAQDTAQTAAQDAFIKTLLA